MNLQSNKSNMEENFDFTSALDAAILDEEKNEEKRKQRHVLRLQEYLTYDKSSPEEKLKSGDSNYNKSMLTNNFLTNLSNEISEILREDLFNEKAKKELLAKYVQRLTEMSHSTRSIPAASTEDFQLVRNIRLGQVREIEIIISSVLQMFDGSTQAAGAG
jgi:actin-related protein